MYIINQQGQRESFKFKPVVKETFRAQQKPQSNLPLLLYVILFICLAQFCIFKLKS